MRERYVKSLISHKEVKNGEIISIVDKWYTGNGLYCRTKSGKLISLSYSECEPATEEEYYRSNSVNLIETLIL